MKSDGMYATLSASSTVDYGRWVHELLYEGWFSREHHHALNEDLVELVCCYPNLSPAAVPRNRERIQDAIVDVTCEDVPCRESDLPSHVRDTFRSYIEGAAKSLKAKRPLSQGETYLAVWNQKFPGKWRPEPESGQQQLWHGLGYSCWINAKGKLRWRQARFMPGRDYDAGFFGIEFSKRCSLEMVRAIAEYKRHEAGPMLNPSLAAALAMPAGMSEDGTAQPNATGGRRRRSDEELLRILADSKSGMLRGEQARRLGVSARRLRDLIQQAQEVQSRAQTPAILQGLVGRK